MDRKINKKETVPTINTRWLPCRYSLSNTAEQLFPQHLQGIKEKRQRRVKTDMETWGGGSVQMLLKGWMALGSAVLRTGLLWGQGCCGANHLQTRNTIIFGSFPWNMLKCFVHSILFEGG